MDAAEDDDPRCYLSVASQQVGFTLPWSSEWTVHVREPARLVERCTETRARSSIIGDEKLKSTRKPDASMLLLAGRSFLIGHLSRPIDLFRFLDYS
jgi:hypothetical protein